MHAGVTTSEYNTLRPNRGPRGLQQSFSQKLEDDFFNTKDDSYKNQTVLERSSFTSMCCIPQSNRSYVKFYWVDGTRGLLGEGTIQQTSVDTLHSGGKGEVITPNHGTICNLRVLLKELKRPAWVAVAPKESLSHKVFFTEEDRTPKGEGGGSISMLDTKTGEVVPILTGLYEIRGLQIMDTMDMFFLERGGIEGCFGMLVVDGRMVGKAGEGEQLVKKELFKVWEKKKQGHCVRYEGFTMLPDGRILLAARVTNTTNNEADAQGAVYILHPSSITEEAVLPLFPQEPEKHDHEEEMVSDENGGEEVKLEGGMEQPLAVEADPVGIEGPAQSKAEDEEVVLLPPIVGEENGQGNAPSLEVSGSNEVTQAPSSAPAAPEIEEAFSSNTALRHTSKATGIKTEKKQVPQRKVSQASKKSLNVPMSRESLDKSLGKSLKPPKAGNPGRRKSSLKQKEPPPLEEPAPPVFVPRPRPYIPKLKMSRVEDVMFYAGVPQPVPLDPLTACRRNYHRALYTYEEGDKSLILECLPLTRTITSNPFTGRVVVGFCGADPKGLLCSFGILDFNTEASCSLRPIMGGFSECLAIDAYDNVITRSGRKDGKLRILWANGSHGWGKILLREAALVDLPSSPKGEEKEMGKTKNMGLKMIKEMQTLRQDTQVQDALSKTGKVNTMVVLRCRPLLDSEKETQPALSCTEYDVTVDGSYLPLKQKKVFTFDRVFDGTTKQQEVYSTVVAPMVERVLEGFHCTIFAYGQTGSGKTFTMEGSMDDTELAGIIPRSVFTLFKMLERLQDSSYSIQASHIEIYNQHIFDLLDESNSSQNLKIVEDESHRTHLRGARQVLITSPHQIFRVLRKSMRNRHTAETLCNRVSSRSHAVFSITVNCTYMSEKEGKVNFDGRLNLVDLSGSENIKRSGSEGVRAQEAGNIGQSLLAFSRVITGLVQCTPHIPYRDSKLTHLLSDSLGGKAYTTIILNVTPSQYVLDETLNTLNYAALARHVHTTPMKHVHRTLKDGGKQEEANREGEEEQEELGGMPVMPWRGSIPLVRSHHATTVKREMKLYHSISKEWVETNLLDSDGEVRQNTVHLLQSVYSSFDTEGKGRLRVADVKRMEESWFKPKEGEDQDCKPPLSRKLARAGKSPLLSVGHKKVLTFDGLLGFIKSVALKDPVLVKRIVGSVGSGEPPESEDKETRTLPNNEQALISAAIEQEATKTRHAIEAALPVSSGFVGKGAIFKWLQEEVKPKKVAYSRPQSAQTGQRKIPTSETSVSISRLDVPELQKSAKAKYFKTTKLRPNSAPLRKMSSPRNFRTSAEGFKVPTSQRPALVALIVDKPTLPSCEWCSKEMYPGSNHGIAFCSSF